jgi:hypothetical protein
LARGLTADCLGPLSTMVASLAYRTPDGAGLPSLKTIIWHFALLGYESWRHSCDGGGQDSLSVVERAEDAAGKMDCRRRCVKARHDGILLKKTRRQQIDQSHTRCWSEQANTSRKTMTAVTKVAKRYFQPALSPREYRANTARSRPDRCAARPTRRSSSRRSFCLPTNNQSTTFPSLLFSSLLSCRRLVLLAFHLCVHSYLRP